MAEDNANAQGNPETAKEVARVAIKIPPVFKKNIKSWLGQIEAQFHLAAVTNEVTKYYYLFSALDPDIASDLSDHLDKPLGTHPYTDLKERMLAQFQQSEGDKIRTLLNNLELGDGKPSVMARKMKTLAPELPDNFLLQMFKQRLPGWVSAILATITNPTLEEAARVADKIMENTPNGQVCSATKQGTSSDALNMEALEDKMVAKMRKMMSEMLQDHIPRSAHRRRSTSRSRFPRSRSNNQYCWYHNRFGEKATKCEQPCTYQGNAPARH